MVEKAQFTCVNEQFEIIFNAELAERCVLRQPPGFGGHWGSMLKPFSFPL
ncbi:MAG: hypothetical protein HN826_14075 [Methylococcales bacterium]|nr:hypothetical protein [Methylococcales bacterium]